MKKIFALILAGMMALCMTACGSSDTDETEPSEAAETTEAAEETISGGWEITPVADITLPEDVQGAFKKLMVHYDETLIPAAYIGKQIVSGTNYELICYSEEEGVLQSVCVYEDLDGNVNEAIVNDFEIGEYTEDQEADTDEEITGGWEVPEDYTKAELPDGAAAAFEKAAAELDGNELEPMACLGTQVVAGTNYAILCHSTLVTADPVSSVQLVVVYEDLDGNAEITSICALDPAELND